MRARHTCLKSSDQLVCTRAVTLVVTLVGSMLLDTRAKDGPICGVHTIRADEAVLSLVREASCSFAVQVFDWSHIEPLP
jgi:hypothetical protein